MKLADLQDQFQRAILGDKATILDAIPDSPRETKTKLFDVYRNAYGLRLVEILQHEFEKLHSYMGDDAFDKMARAYIAAHPSRWRNARWIGSELAAFLNSDASYKKRPVLADLARLEQALNDAFDAADASVLQIEQLAVVAPDDWGKLVFQAHSSVCRLDFNSNAGTIWTALGSEKDPPKATRPKSVQRLIVWRQQSTAKFRRVSAEEAMMWDEAHKGVKFSVLCEMLATYDDPDQAPMRAASYLKGWIDGGLLTAAGV